MKIIITFILSSLFLINSSPLINSNDYNVTSGSYVKITGTSSLHDWEEQVNKFTCDVSATITEGNIDIESISFIAQTKSIKSHSSIMDGKTYKALKSDAYPEIKFKSTNELSCEIIGNNFKGTIKGVLSLAGQNHNVNVYLSGKVSDGKLVQLSGSKNLKMTDFGIDPPTAMLGTLTTGDDIKVIFNLKY